MVALFLFFGNICLLTDTTQDQELKLAGRVVWISVGSSSVNSTLYYKNVTKNSEKNKAKNMTQKTHEYWILQNYLNFHSETLFHV